MRPFLPSLAGAVVPALVAVYTGHVMHVRELFDLTGKVAVVTGGSRGLGLEIAHGLGEAGASVVVTARRQEWLGPALEELEAAGIDALAVTCDVADESQVARLAAEAHARYERVDILVN